MNYFVYSLAKDNRKKYLAIFFYQICFLHRLSMMSGTSRSITWCIRLYQSLALVSLIRYVMVLLDHHLSSSSLTCIHCGACVCLQDVNDRWSFQYPQLYSPGQMNQYFSKMAFARILLHSCYSSLILFFVPWAAMWDTVRDDGKDIADYQSFALLAQTCLLIAVSVQVNCKIQHTTITQQKMPCSCIFMSYSREKWHIMMDT